MNKELEEYFEILCKGDYPLFINKYIKTDVLQRLKYIGQFCGCNYTKIYNIKFFYTRLDHSIATALMTYNFTHNKIQTLFALFHDLGTPCFSHVIDFYYNDFINQNSSEKDVYEIIKNSDEIKACLEKDSIDINEFKNIKKYSIVENEKPKLCVDRLDGILHTNLIWLNKRCLSEIKEVYDNIVVLNNEEKEEEIGFKSIDKAIKFFEMIYIYSIELQSNEDKYIMKYIADSVSYLIKNKYIEIKDLYTFKEQDIVKLLRDNIKSFKTFENLTSLKRSDTKPPFYNVSLETKKRYVNPLCKYNNNNIRLKEISSTCQKLLEEYLNYKDTLYVYSDKIEEL